MSSDMADKLLRGLKVDYIAWSWRVLEIKGIQLLNNTYNYNTKKTIVLENI